MRKLKKLMSVILMMLLCGCVKVGTSGQMPEETANVCGGLSVSVKYETVAVKSLAGYEMPTSDESAVHRLDVLVFNAVTKVLERSASLSSMPVSVDFELPVGEKLVYAVANGPDLSSVQSLEQMLVLKEDLSARSYPGDGFVMLGYEVCVVAEGIVSKPSISVKRLVSRVELRSLKCNLPKQYGSMTVESVFLGSAHSVQSLSGVASVPVNNGGHAGTDPMQPIGLDGVVGSCPAYMYREPGIVVKVGETAAQPVYMYCQPDSGKVLTCLYILAAIGEDRYYYRVPLDKGLSANATCVVDAVITNLGALDPPGEHMHKGEIQAVVKVMDWLTGEEYHAEF